MISARTSALWLSLSLAACGSDDGPRAQPLGAAGAAQAGAAGAAQAGAAGAAQAGAAQAGGAGTSQAGSAGAAGTAQGGGAGAGAVLSVAATDKTIPLPFTISLTGKGTSKVGDVAIDGNVGTVTIGGTSYPAVSYEHQAWAEFGYDLFQTLAAGPDRLYSMWFYCKGGVLDWVYLEGTDGTKMTDEPAAKGGTCVLTATPVTPVVKLPAVSLPAPQPISGFDVKGAQIDLPSGQKGTLTLGPLVHDVYVFDTVDCSKDCGTPGWWELHALLWDPKSARLCFSIFYLFAGQQQISAQYTLTLPDLTDPVGNLTLTATWSKL